MESIVQSSPGACGIGAGTPRFARSLLPPLRADQKALQAIEPQDPLRVHSPAPPAKQHRQATVSILRPGVRQLAQPHPKRLLRRSNAPIAGTRAARSRRSGPWPCARARVARQASEFPRERVLQDLLVERQVRDQALELAVFLLELLEPLQLAGREPPVFLPPGVEGRLPDPELPAQLLERNPGLDLGQRMGDLLRSQTRFPCHSLPRSFPGIFQIPEVFPESPGQSEGMTTTAQSGYTQISPYYTVASKSQAELRALADRLGLNPSARTRIGLVRGESEVDLLT